MARRHNAPLLVELLANGIDPLAPGSYNRSLMALSDAAHSASFKSLSVAPSVLTAANCILRLGEQPRQIVFDAIDLAALIDGALWVEFEMPNGCDDSEAGETVSQPGGRLLREGWLITKEVGSGSNVSFTACRFGERETTFEAERFIIRIVRQLGVRYGVVVDPVLDLTKLSPEEKAAVPELGAEILSLLAVLGAPKLTEIVDAKLDRRGGLTRLREFRMASQWTDLDRNGVPMLPRAVRSGLLYDELMDSFDLNEGLIWSGRSWFNSAEDRLRALKVTAARRDMLKAAEPFVLGASVAESAAIVAAEERTGMGEARRQLALPFPRAWLEWQGVECGLPGQRWGMFIEALDENVRGDAHGIIFPARLRERLEWEDITRQKGFCFHLRISNPDEPIVSFPEAYLPAGVDPASIDQDLFGRFILAVLTFLTQPRMTETRVREYPERVRSNRVRAERRLAPLGTVREIRLLIDEPAFSGSGPRTGGGPVQSGTMPRHQVRAFWRYRMGKLEFVRPHWRGSEANGISRRRYLVMQGGEQRAA
ncbi:hypothetical protein ACHMW5_11875 [Azospirillum melinis]|uniref:hypothetical protein n=1 Tax=Azospirillum TaxID=191 RepID=UPI000D61A386|nr:hypothetical protein [Azospirillum sp. TSA6c]PWC47893.1 hypothetical protein TSA6c_15420 [Azospirillum sp. TSA6c]